MRRIKENSGFDHIDFWIFDLDNTLYPPDCNLFAQVDQRMGEFISTFLDVPFDEAKRIQKAYWRQYGTTLNGLMSEHGMKPDAFLAYVHDVDLTAIPRAPALDGALGGLEGRKIVFTNGSTAHAENVLERLGVTHHFDEIFDIAAADFVPKPRPEPYEKLIGRAGIKPRSAAMIEDIAQNLEPAHALGMTTIWVPTEAAWSRLDPDEDLARHPAHVHHVVDDLIEFLTRAAPSGRR